MKIINLNVVFSLKLEARLWKDNAYFMAGEIRYNLEFGEASGVELDQAYAVRVRALNAAGKLSLLLFTFIQYHHR